MNRYPGVTKRPDGTFRVRVKARDPKTGKIKELKRVLAATTYAEAARAKQELRESVEVASTSTRQRVRDYARSWLTSKLPALKPSTAHKYALILDHHVLPALGDFYLDALARTDIIGWRDAQQGKPSTINGRLRVLRTLLADATVELNLVRNPSARVATIKEPFHEGDPNRLTADQLRRVLATFEEHEPGRYALFLTLALTAARVGEVTALKWGDVDFDGEAIHIRRAHWMQKVGSTKTGPTRTVPMREPLTSVLKAHRRSLIERQASGLQAGWVFPSARGTLIWPSTLQRPLKRALAAAGVTERFTIHGFRRTANNLMRQVASGEVVRSITGHVTERMTEHYSHVESEEKHHAADEVRRLLFPVEGGTLGGTLLAGTNKETS